jgi:hypothetical protein
MRDARERETQLERFVSERCLVHRALALTVEFGSKRRQPSRQRRDRRGSDDSYAARQAGLACSKCAQRPVASRGELCKHFVFAVVTTGNG